jgi:hypothetical protein
LGTKKWLIILPPIMAVELTLAKGNREEEEKQDDKNKK